MYIFDPHSRGGFFGCGQRATDAASAPEVQSELPPGLRGIPCVSSEDEDDYDEPAPPKAVRRRGLLAWLLGL